ncbi:family 16 glycosylhydrolase [Mesorhizobium sp. BAC0120]|uniref:family 16 glycosylhydrolase n=1 Tax=Mesorhizobium sp. BAC0120 TaxID=3090670 RepID=UPI00298CF682|nr:family 16 glycosylhydrolase [Mesorhizobium sp. BAC0120]MDW6024943.1 family 16 glycosylhydrolase [Mesorhizobium sp. BAC0120]
MAYELNANGVPLYYSGSSTHWYSATSAGSLYGSSSNDSLYGDSSIAVTMFGGDGDDIYYLYSGKNKAFEYAGQGIDTINTWMDYKLPDNFENLIVTGDKRFAFGNSLNNIISGGSGSQTLDGFEGDDILKGGAGADTFIVTKGNGSDLILDFGSDDLVRIGSYGFTSFDQVKANMVQAGANVRLNLSSSESLVFANKTIGQFSASQFQLAIDKSHMHLSFSDDFDTLSLWNGSDGTWDSNFWWGKANGSTLESQQQWFIDTDYGPTKSANPFSVEDGHLTITAAKASTDIQPYINNYKYTSGLLTTHESFSQLYGYFEMRADMPSNHGAWPAFWLLPEDGSWPPELDVIEMKGQEPNTLIQTAHSNATGQHTQDRSNPAVENTEGYHTYGLLWTDKELVWYFDDTEVVRTATPADMHKPMYMLVNLGLGGMAGTPDLSSPAEMHVDYVNAYQLNNDWIV